MQSTFLTTCSLSKSWFSLAVSSQVVSKRLEFIIQCVLFLGTFFLHERSVVEIFFNKKLITTTASLTYEKCWQQEHEYFFRCKEWEKDDNGHLRDLFAQVDGQSLLHTTTTYFVAVKYRVSKWLQFTKMLIWMNWFQLAKNDAWSRKFAKNGGCNS